MGWFTKKKENPVYDFFVEQAKILGVTYESTVPQGLGLFTKAYERFGSDPNFAKTGLQYSYDILPNVMGWPNKAAVLAAAGEGDVTDVIAGGIIKDLKDPEWQGENIGAMLSYGENLGAQGNTTGVYGGVPQLLGMIENIGGTSTQDLGGFLNRFAGLLGIGGGNIENVIQAVDKIDEKEVPWT